MLLVSGMFFPLWDILNGTRYDASAPPPSCAKPKEVHSAKQLDAVNPYVDAYPMQKNE